MAELSLIAKATILLALALTAGRAVTRAPASVRALLLASAFGGVLILPVAALLVTPRAIVIPMGHGSQGHGAISAPTAALASSEPDTSRTGRDAAARPASGASVPSIATLLRLVWLAGGLVFLAPLLTAAGRLRHIRRGSATWSEGAALASRAAERAGVTRRVSVVLSPHVTAPMTYGLVRPVIAFPADAPAWTRAEIHRALLHELEHVYRYDWAVHIVARTACAFYWFHPLAWAAWRRLSLESEHACDDAVLRGADRTAYAEQLVLLARRLTAHTPAPLLSMADRSNLASRVHAVLDPRLARGRAGAVPASFIVGVTLGVALLVSPMQATAPSTQAPATSLSIPTEADGPGFVAASIRPNAPDDRQRVSDWHLPSGRFTGRNQTLRWFIAFAYAPQTPLFMEPESVSGGPDWIDRERFTLEATAGREVTTAEMQRLVRQVLASRFGLRVHVEPRKGPVYRLVRSRTDGRFGPELRVTDDGCAKPSARGRDAELGTRTEFPCTTMGRLASELSERLGRPVIDATGFEEVFDASLTAARTPEELAVIYGLAPSAVPAELQTGVSIFTAMQEQLGLRLEPMTADVDVLVIDSAQRPLPNDASPDVRDPGRSNP